MLAIRRACESIRKLELCGAALYSTLQHYGMRTMASIRSKIGRVVYGAGREDVHPMYSEACHIATRHFISDAYREDIEIEGDCLAAESTKLYHGPDGDLPVEERGKLRPSRRHRLT